MDVVIDFSVPAGVQAIVGECVERAIPLVVATTGLNDVQRQVLDSAADKNSAALVAEHEPGGQSDDEIGPSGGHGAGDHASGADVEIIERHHRYKEDAPSGTALKFGQIIAEAMGQTEHRHGREGRPGIRPHGEIGYHAMRAGDNPGEHTIIFGMLGETIELSVRATQPRLLRPRSLGRRKIFGRQTPGTVHDGRRAAAVG